MSMKRASARISKCSFPIGATRKKQMTRRHSKTASLFVAAMLLASLSGAEECKPVFPDSPRLATTRKELAEEMSRDDFAAKRAAAVKAADGLVTRPIPVPKGHGSWIFYYACPDDGATLRMLSLDEHECPKCKRKYVDKRTVAAYRCQMHYDLERAALKLGWAYAYTDDDKYATQVRRILLHLADAYADYPPRLDRWGRRGWLAPLGGRRYVQSLDEAVGVIRLAKAYDLTRRSAVWKDDDRKHVEDDFFRATAATLLRFNQGINNHQTWYNAGLMAIASVLADEQLVEKVLTMRGGFRDQLQRSLGDDGVWYEGAMAYQNYALQAMVEIVDAGRKMGLPLHEESRFKKLLTSSLNVAYPDGRYPAINDSDPSSFRNFNWSYQWAWRTYGDPVFAQAASWGKPKLLAELLGSSAKPQWPLATKSMNLADAGLAILRVGDGTDQSCVFFDYGRHGGGHGHYDKMNITLFANGREWLLDTGRIGYSHKEYKTWVKHTVAHNTVVVNRSNQWPATGSLHWLKTGGGWAACAGECKTAYVGVSMRRYLLLTKQMLVDVLDVQATRDIQIDWLAHAVSEPVEPVDEHVSMKIDKLGSGSGYQHLVDARRWKDTPSRWDFPAGKQRLRLWLAGNEADEIHTAIGIGSSVNQKAPALIRRRASTRDARFVTVYDLSGAGNYVTDVESTNDEHPEVTIKTIDRDWTIEFTKQDVVVGLAK